MQNLNQGKYSRNYDRMESKKGEKNVRVASCARWNYCKESAESLRWKKGAVGNGDVEGL